MKVKGTRQLYYQDIANRETTRDERLCHHATSRSWDSPGQILGMR